jgi:hypothetical protein
MQHRTATGPSARQLKHEGQQMALFGAGSAWVAEAIAALRLFIMRKKREHGGAAVAGLFFTFDEFRAWAEEHRMVERPVSLNAWGALPRIAMRQNLIEPTNTYAVAQRPLSHGRTVKIWRAL